MLNVFSIIRNKLLPFGVNNQSTQGFSTTYKCCDKVPETSSPGATATSSPGSGASCNPHVAAKTLHKPNNLERRFLVWTGKYKRIEDVPGMVSMDVMERARNRARIRIANYMMAATAIACIAMAISGKRAAERGESVQKMNLDWHKEMNDQYKKDQAAATAAGASTS
ncbi:UPF0389 protein CG9231 [Chrysoperla carnea]|uniref:UPF0389 protein CG9231 n=1 Tax=Chrysoperla carnea TaxID=189513 RepID=UPI001D075DCF|nr:UPF0389 protein CG9231 [Chrysoperla carnea]